MFLWLIVRSFKIPQFHRHLMLAHYRICSESTLTMTLSLFRRKVHPLKIMDQTLLYKVFFSPDSFVHWSVTFLWSSFITITYILPNDFRTQIATEPVKYFCQILCLLPIFGILHWFQIIPVVCTIKIKQNKSYGKEIDKTVKESHDDIFLFYVK